MEKTLALSVVIGAALGRNYFSTFDSAQTKAVKLGKAFSDTDRKLQAANGVIKYRSLLAALQQKQVAAGGSNKRLAAGINDVEERYKKAKRAARSYGIEIGDVVRQQQKLSRESTDLTRRINRLNKAQAARDRLSSLRGRALGAVGAAYGAGRVIGDALDAERRQIRLQTVINADDGDTKAAVVRARKHAFETAKNSLASEVQLLDIQYGLSSAGLSEEASRVGSEVVSKVATVTSGVPERVAEIVGTTFNNMGDSIDGSGVDEKLGRIGDVLTKTQLKYQIRDFGQLGESMKMAGSQANISRVGLEETAVALGLLNSAGLQGSQGGTAFSATLRQMKKASDELGFSIVRDADGQMDLAATLQNVDDALSLYDDIDERGQIIQDIFGDEGKRGLEALTSGLDEYRQGLAEIRNSEGVVDEKYQLFEGSASGQWMQTTQNLKLVGNVLATTLLPAINTVLNPVAKLLAGAATIVREFPVIGWVLGGITAGFVLYSTWLGVVTAAQWLWNSSLAAGYGALLKTGIGLTWSGVAYVGAAAKIGAVTAAQWLWNAAMLANPVGLVIAGVALLIGGAYALYRNWDTVIAWFNEKLESIGEKFSWIGSLWDGLFGGDDAEAKVTLAREDRVVGQLPADVDSEPFKIGQVADKPTASLPVDSQQLIKGTDKPSVNDSKVASISIHAPITVNPGPGMDEKEVARQMNAALKERERQAEAAQRSALYDYAGA